MKVRVNKTNTYTPLSVLVEENLPCYYKENIITKEVCTEYAKVLCSVTNDDKGIANLLYLHSNECLIISQLLQLKKTVSISELSLNECSYEFISIFEKFLPNCDIKYNKICKEKFSKLKFKYVVKYFYNLVFLFFGNFLKLDFTNKRLLKAWVDISFDIYKKSEFDMVIILPFFISINRQILFIKYLIQNKYCFTLYGYGYSIINLIKFLLNPTCYNLNQLELSGSNHFAKYIKNRGNPKLLLCTDEFEPLNYQIYKDFMDEGIYVKNKSHGIGKYCPYVNYSNFEVFNSSMARFYDNKCIKLRSQFSNKNIGNTIKYIIFVDQNTSFKSFQVLRSEIISILIDIVNQTNLKCMIKIHPNQKSASESNLKCINDFGKYLKNSLVINIFSSCYYSVNDCVKNIYITNHIYSGDIYDYDSCSVSIEDLPFYIRQLQ